MKLGPALTVVRTLLVLSLAISPVVAAEDALLRLERSRPSDRNTMIAGGVQIVADLGEVLLARGPQEQIERQARESGLSHSLVVPDLSGRSLALVGFRAAVADPDFTACGTVLLQEEEWALVELDEPLQEQCLGSPDWFLRRLDLSPLEPMRPEPEWLVKAVSHRKLLEVDPLVQAMVDGLSDARALQIWHQLVNSASTRYTTSQGCHDAAAMAFQFFADLGLAVEYQQWSGNHAPNVVATIPGSGVSDEIVVVVGHLDDMPSAGAAPGADDNASGSAMVMAVAEAMAGYCYEREIRFILVTGEEVGLYGSAYDADESFANGDNIIAVLNGDMIGWDGGNAATEDLDLNTNSASAALGNLFVSAAQDYATGCTVNAFSCPTMVYSDHASYWDNGYAAVCGITDNEGFCGQGGSYGYYHTSSDTIANCGSGAETFFGGAVRAYLATAAHLADPLAAIPAAPEGVNAAAGADNTVTLSWSSAGQGLEYHLSRAPGGCAQPADFEDLGSTTALSFADTTASGGVTYAYVAHAVDPSGSCSSEASLCVEAVTTGPCSEPPEFAGVGEVRNLAESSCGLEIVWSAGRSFCGPAPRYDLHRSTVSGFSPSPGTLLASGLAGLSWLDTLQLSHGTPYYYMVRAVDPSVQVQDANQVEASGTPTGIITSEVWTDDGGDTGTAQLSMADPWSNSASGGVDNSRVYTTGAYDSYRCGALRTPPLSLGENARLAFSSTYDIEDGWDKGEVQISINGGSSWSRLELDYPRTSSRSGDQCGLPSGRTYFTGSGLGWERYTVSLDAWAGEEVMIRWLMSSDVTINGSGWLVDDIAITLFEQVAECSAEVEPLFADSFETGDVLRWSTASANRVRPSQDGSRRPGAGSLEAGN